MGACIASRYHSFSTLDLLLLHSDGAMGAMKLVVESFTRVSHLLEGL